MMLVHNRRTLADLIVELAQGLGITAASGDHSFHSLRPVSAEFRLPIDARFDESHGLQSIFADVPRTRTRTVFDPPHGTLVLTLVTEPSS